MRIDKSAQRVRDNDAGHYYAMQFEANTTTGKRIGGGYIGLQPRQDGKALVLFSGYGRHFSAPEGTKIFDEVAGGSNSTTIDFEFGHKYDLTIERDETDHSLLKAYAQDVTDPDHAGPRVHVKDLKVDQPALVASRQVGFIEHYGKSISKSSEIAQTVGSFYAPTGVSAGGKTIEGTLSNGELRGRYKHSLTGTREVTQIGNRIAQVKLDIRGAAPADPAPAR